MTTVDANHALPNWKMIDHVLDSIKEDEDGFSMCSWVKSGKRGDCKTTKCFAGWTLELTGHSVTFNDRNSDMEYGVHVDGRIAEPLMVSKRQDIVGLTAQELNMSYADTHDICYSTRLGTVEELEERILEILGPRPLDQ